MPQVAVQINGKTYRMACDEGQESHLLDLAQRFEKHISTLKGSFGEIGDQRLTVMAGIMVQDELVETQRKVARLESELSDARKLSGGSSDREGEIAEALVKTAQRIESISEKLSKTG